MIRQEKTTLRPKIEHIHDLEWQKAEIQVPENLQTVRQKAMIDRQDYKGRTKD